MRKSKRIFALSLILSVLLAVFLPCKAASADSYENRIDSVHLTKDSSLNVKASLAGYYVNGNSKDMLYLLALPAYENNLSEEYAVASCEVSKKPSFTVKDNFDITTKFVIATESNGTYTAITDFHYLDNPEALAKYNTKKSAIRSIKGLSFKQCPSLMNELYLSNTVIDIDICDFLLDGHDSDSVEYIHNGLSRFFDGNAVAELDDSIGLCRENGVSVYLKILLSDKLIGSDFGFLYHQNEPVSGAEYYAPDMTDPECFECLECLFSFLSDRYLGSNDPAVCAFIIGNGLNSNRELHYYGKAKLDEFAANCVLEVRLCASVSRSVNANTKVYVSLSNNFGAKSRDLSQVGNDLLDYSAKDFLCAFNSLAAKEGNFSWDVAADGSPSEKNNAYFNRDTNALFSDNTPYVTAKNISVLESFLAQDEYKYENNVRRIIIDRFAVSSENESSGELLQAASYACAYYHIRKNSSTVDAFIYSEIFDKNGTSLGIVNRDGEKKAICDVIKSIDSGTDFDIYGSLPAYLGCDSWKDIIGTDSAPSDTAYPLYCAKPCDLSDISRNLFKECIFDFDGSKQGFTASTGTLYTELVFDPNENKTVLRSVSGELLPYESSLIVCKAENPVSFSHVKYLSIRFLVDSGDSDSEIALCLYGVDGAVCELNGTARSGAFTDLYFDISDFSNKHGKVDRITIRTSGNAGTSCCFSDISVYTANSKKAEALLIWIMLIVFIVAVAYAVSRNIRKKRNKNRQIRFDI